jgi:hypothetical protein
MRHHGLRLPFGLTFSSRPCAPEDHRVRLSGLTLSTVVGRCTVMLSEDHRVRVRGVNAALAGLPESTAYTVIMNVNQGPRYAPARRSDHRYGFRLLLVMTAQASTPGNGT